jgi:type II secretory pathway pseudopilin PulG
MTAKTIVLRILLCITIIALWAWVAADDWEQEQELERSERERIQAIQAYNKSKLSPAQSEDEVDTTPLPIAEAEPTYISAPVQRAKNSVVKAKKRIKKTVKKN